MRTLLVLLAPICCVGTLDGQVSVFNSRVDVVRVSALVTNRGQPVQGLQKHDFEVRDNGIVQGVELVGVEEVGTTVVLSLDVSASVTGEPLVHLKAASHLLLEQLSPRDRVALVTFNQAVRLEHPLTNDVKSLRRTIDTVTASGGTALVNGSYSAITTAGADAGRNLVILFSDGLDTASWLAPDAVLQSVKRSDVVVYGVTIRGRTGPSFLRDLCELTGGSVIEIESSRDLSRVFLRILDEFRQRYLLFYVPRGVAPSGWHRIDVRVKDRASAVRARPGYQSMAP